LQDDLRNLVGGLPPRRHQSSATLPPYQSDFLTNYEFGWKTEWLDHRLRWNGGMFQENGRTSSSRFSAPTD
jgi:outer membrane receptor for ferric coprogen and ferric-rhodotorulic acid